LLPLYVAEAVTVSTTVSPRPGAAWSVFDTEWRICPNLRQLEIVRRPGCLLCAATRRFRHAESCMWECSLSSSSVLLLVFIPVRTRRGVVCMLWLWVGRSMLVGGSCAPVLVWGSVVWSFGAGLVAAMVGSCGGHGCVLGVVMGAGSSPAFLRSATHSRFG
jgi:hypothetical protein